LSAFLRLFFFARITRFPMGKNSKSRTEVRDLTSHLRD
jgi:hypothetical protein